MMVCGGGVVWSIWGNCGWVWRIWGNCGVGVEVGRRVCVCVVCGELRKNRYVREMWGLGYGGQGDE